MKVKYLILRGTVGFIPTPDINRLAKISFDERMKYVGKNLGTKIQVMCTINLTTVTKTNAKLHTFNSSYFSDAETDLELLQHLKWSAL